MSGGGRMIKPEKFWDFIAKNFDRQEDRPDPTYNKIVENTRKHLHNEDIVLDFGCGTGTYTFDFSEYVKEIHGIDISQKMIDIARRKARENRIENAFFTKSTIYDEKLEKSSFDVVLAMNILHLLTDSRDIIKRIHELLKPEGSFISTTPCMGNMGAFLSFLLFIPSKIGIIPDIQYYKTSDLEELIKNGNFGIVETETFEPSSQNNYIVAKKI
jgi:2-polyprenyl-3-methyl-5-hydroxy-6-metoxy-1,4-benzoquinol methylase